MTSLPAPPNAAWTPPLDINDEQTLQQEEHAFEQELKVILNQDISNPLGSLDQRDEQQEQQEDDVDDMEEYGDQIQIPEI